MYETLNKFDLIKELPADILLLFYTLPKEKASLILEQVKKTLMQCYIKEKTNISNVTDKLMHELNANIIKTARILSLTETPTNLLIWGHYAHSHTSFVIEFDTQGPFFHQRRSNKDEFGYLRKIVYRKVVPYFDPLSDDIINHFTIKSSDWSYEHEWRMLLPHTHSEKIITVHDKDYDLYKIPSGAIKRVILGCKASNNLRGSIIRIITNRSNYRHVSLMQASQSSSKFELEFKPL
ncbi:DUF2971 domain-containing protein [Lelliottia sp. WAP21]|uniref:DUF2971 domain-containing protein n=1 Tax=Lelliottia sp. WAP21 TaxID=2877426 RepID=UPI001E4779B9|nr:DUF2971 domain-containing protein [Lelliottia sp. WAP21]